MSNSKLISYTKLSPNRTKPRNHKIDTVTIHCMAGNLSVESCGAGFAKASRKASSNYGIGSDGRIALYVDEANRSWCSSNAKNDHRAITIEVASNKTHPYAVSAKAYASLIDLLVDICQRNGIKKLVWSTSKTDRVNHKNGCNMTVHRDYAAKACPGDYLYSRHGAIAETVNARLGGASTAKAAEATTAQSAASYKVRVTATALNIRKGPGTSYAATGQIRDKGVYTIVKEQNGWGYLKSGAGWIALKYTKKV